MSQTTVQDQNRWARAVGGNIGETIANTFMILIKVFIETTFSYKLCFVCIFPSLPCVNKLDRFGRVFGLFQGALREKVRVMEVNLPRGSEKLVRVMESSSYGSSSYGS